MALLVPDLDLFISLSGAICMSTLSLITPALLELIVRHPGKTFFTFVYGNLSNLRPLVELVSIKPEIDNPLKHVLCSI